MRLGTFEQDDTARFQATLPITATSSLHHGIASGNLAIDAREVHIHARLDQLRGHQQTPHPVAESSLDLFQNFQAMGRAHLGTQVKDSVAPGDVLQVLVDPPCVTPRAHNDKR